MIVSVTVTDSRESEIGDAIRSVVDHVDRVLLVDTGATDATIERAEEVARSKLTVVRHAWVDFSAARNAAIDAAEAIGAEWIVIVDSDERINFGPSDLRRSLARTHADVLLVESDDGHYPKQKILRAGFGGRFFGPTHEALVGGSQKPHEVLLGATFSERPKTEDQLKRKCARDIALLTPFAQAHPDDPRWLYYLGAALEGLGDRAQAAQAFGECVRLRKTGEEAAWAAFKQAEQLLHLRRFDEAIEAATVGIRVDATSAECAWVAAESSLNAGRNDQAIAWARISEAVGRHKGCGPERLYFRHLPALYELPYEVLRSALTDAGARETADRDFHAAKIARVRAISRYDGRDLDWLSVSRSVPESTRWEVRSMLRPSALSRFCPSARDARIQFEPPGGRLPMNPSICLHRGELWCVVRAVNYTMCGRVYTIHDPHNVVRTENHLGRLDEGYRLVDPVHMLDLDPSPKRPSRVVGYEDVRLVSVSGRNGDVLTGSATVCDRAPDEMRRIARLHLDARGNVKRADVQPSNQICEKNWMPLAVDGEFTWIYSLDPTAILPGPLRACPFALEHLRGGAATAFGDGYLCVTHEVVDEPKGRIYLHRFVRLDPKFNVTHVSPAWIFSHFGIEFCAGIVHHAGRIILSYGIEDREAWITSVDAKEIEAMKWITP